ncbi:putative Rubrerythrin-like protein [Nitrospina gracilis 3/211]|uniref:Putative Rubrerythrin-like protein n=1 Tax=Nitrospina gracilis (strain 3/211) TaxID=1266370 RepID=M1YN53_NITG3|nr:MULTISPECIES: ferritin family protein [Nitrospina]MCF8722502.1 rubrerythrin [Nitrospina sp. Nb-3]CCQ91932.1 putative Rubrerythrin-like protein [Nitrospina gracilis 3/211]
MTTSLGEDLRTTLQCSDAVQICMAMEREGIAYYERAARNVNDDRVRQVLEHLADQEKDHARTLQEKSRFLQPAVQRRTPEKPEVQRFIRQQILGKVFPETRRDRPQSWTDAEALEIGIQSEKNSIQILEGLIEQVTKIDVRTVFSHLVVEEKKHLEQLQALRAQLP